MESLAVVLRRVPLFAALPPGNLARIIADLREEHYASGEVICREGDEASDFYIVKSGEIEVSVARNGNMREIVAVRGAPEWFGERALFPDGRRSATVRARTNVMLWRLTKEKFSGLLDDNPWLILHFTHELSDRLESKNTELSNIQSAFAAQADHLFRSLSMEQQTFLMRAAVLPSLDAVVLSEVTGSGDADAALQTLATHVPFLRRGDAAISWHEPARLLLFKRLVATIGNDGARELHVRAARTYERLGRWPQAIDHYLDAEAYAHAGTLLVRHAEAAMERGDPGRLGAWLARLAGTATDTGLDEVRLRFETSAAAAEGQPREGTAPSAGGKLLSPRGRRRIGAALGVVAGLAIAALPAPDGLDATGMRMLGLLAWAVTWWVFDVLPDYVVGIGLILGWILFGIVPPAIALSGFTASPFFLIIGVLGMTASLQSSGLLFRIALYILRSFPLTYRGQALGLSLSGTGITTSIPDTTSGTAIAGPIILALSDSLGYSRRSNGSAGLAMAAMLGFGQMSPFFLTGAAENLLAWGLLPEAAQAQISWGTWLWAALPLAVTTFVLGFAATMLYFPPEFQPTVSRGLVDTQIEALGRPSRAEITNAVVVVSAMVGWITAPYHGIDVAWIAMSGLAVLLAVNLLDRMTFRSGINWDFLFYLGAVLSLTSVVRQLGVDTWVIRELTPIVEPLAATPAQFLCVLTVAIFAARFILPSIPLVSLLTLTIVPIASSAGIHPLVLLLVICTSVTVWFMPYQSTCYLALYFGTKEQAFSHRQVRGLAWTYGAIYLLAVLSAIPYWRALDLLP